MTKSRERYLQVGIPAAILSTVASAFAATPASAADVSTGAIEQVSVPSSRTLPASPKKPSTHRVKQGDTVWAIARHYGVPVSDVVSWNRLGSSATIRPGQVLRLTSPSSKSKASAPKKSTPSAKTHVVASGDTITGIAKKYGTTISTVLAANGLSRSSVIYPGQKIRVSGSAQAATASTTKKTPAKKASSASSSSRTHVVASGDTITGIAKKHSTTISAVLAANGLSRSSIIYPGQRLALPGKKKAATASSTANTQKYVTLNAPQSENARMIIRIGRELGVSKRGIAIALATSMVESGMRNLDWGDRDSVGLFQQRPSTGWGSAKQIQHRDYAIKAFYTGVPHKTRGLLDIPGWKSMKFTDAAQAVQLSAFPLRYGQWEDAAYRWLEQHG